LLIYCKSEEDLIGFVDADWGNNLEDRKSYASFAFKL
jgi:hypothetical protein